MSSANLESRSHHTVGPKIAARIELLYLDIQRLIQADRSLTPARVAELANLASPWIVRDIRKPGWFVKNTTHLFKIEAALSKHPGWAPKTILGEADRQAGGSFIYRRWVDPLTSPEFRDDALLWEQKTSDGAFLERFRDDPWTSILETRGLEASDYRIVQYAPGMIRRYGLNKTGRRLAEHPSPAYQDLTVSDFHEVQTTAKPRCKDVVHINDTEGYRSIFRSIAFPCPAAGVIISRMKLAECRPGRLSFTTSKDPRHLNG